VPWHVGKHEQCNKPFAVIKDSDGSLAGCHDTKDQADAQVRALYANEPEMGGSKRQYAAVSLEGLEIARPGTWYLSTGELSVTPEMLVDAAEFASSPEARPSPVKLGHNDPRFDGEPAMGWLTNLRVEGEADDAVLKGDVVGIGPWRVGRTSMLEAVPTRWSLTGLPCWV
jgi:hypothetical protein